MTRELTPARAKMRVLRAGDSIAHWRLFEASGATLADAAGLSPLTSASVANIEVGPLFGAGNGNRGRNVAADNASAASTAGQRAAMIGGNWTYQAWCTPAAASGTLLVQGAAGDYALVVQLGAGSFVRLQWTAGVSVTVDTGTGLFALSELLHVAIRRRITGPTTCDVETFVNGLMVGTAAALTRASGGATGSWFLGSSASASARFQGTIWETSIASVALSDEAIRESYSRGVRDWDVARCIESGDYTTHRRALIDDGAGGWVDLCDHYGVNWLKGWDDSDGVDDDGATGKLELRRRNEFLSTSPLMTGSRLNVASPVTRLLDVARRIKLEEAIVPHGADRSVVGAVHWGLVFDGFARNVSGGDTHALTLNDKMYALQTAWCQPNRSTSPPTDFRYGATPTAIETVIAAILADHQPRTIAGVAEGYGVDVTLFTPASPVFLIDNAPEGYTVASSMSVAAAITDLVDTTIAWFLRFIWDDNRQEFRLTLADPDRARVFVPAFDRALQPRHVVGDWKKLEFDDGDVRNDVECEWHGSASTDNLGTNKRAFFRLEDLTSVGRFRRRYCRVGLSSSSQLNTLAQVTNLVQMMLSDLAYPMADIEVQTLPRRDIGLGDIVRLAADDVNSDVDVDCAVVGISQNRKGRGSTTLTLRQSAPIGRRRRWFDMMIAVGVNPAAGLSPPPTPAAPTMRAIPEGAVVRWTPPANFGSRRYRETEIHFGPTVGFTPSPATLVGTSRGGSSATIELTPSAAFYCKLLHRDDMNNVSAPSASSLVTPRQLSRSAAVRARRLTNQTLASGTSFQVIVWNIEDWDPLAVHSTSTGVYTSKHNGLLRVDTRAFYDSVSKPGSTVLLAVYVNGAAVAGALSAPVFSSGSPDRAQVALVADVIVAVGDLVAVRISGEGNPGHFVLAGANSRCWFTPVSED